MLLFSKRGADPSRLPQGKNLDPRIFHIYFTLNALDFIPIAWQSGIRGESRAQWGGKN
jgi:hypothetical protein